MTSVEPLFVDRNILIYANVATAPLHEAAVNTKDPERFLGLIKIRPLME